MWTIFIRVSKCFSQFTSTNSTIADVLSLQNLLRISFDAMHVSHHIVIFHCSHYVEKLWLFQLCGKFRGNFNFWRAKKHKIYDRLWNDEKFWGLQKKMKCSCLEISIVACGMRYWTKVNNKKSFIYDIPLITTTSPTLKNLTLPSCSKIYRFSQFRLSAYLEVVYIQHAREISRNLNVN